MIKTVRGSILDAREKYICHQVNCRNAMGSGLAKALYEKWPRVKTSYHAVASEFTSSPQELLGKFQLVYVEDDQYVINVYGQLDYGRDKSVVYTDYDALRRAFTGMAQLDGDFAFPYGFGCGLANGDWRTVYGLIQECFQHSNVTIYQLD